VRAKPELSYRSTRYYGYLWSVLRIHLVNLVRRADHPMENRHGVTDSNEGMKPPTAVVSPRAPCLDALWISKGAGGGTMGLCGGEMRGFPFLLCYRMTMKLG
jgi:hypothetical protein